ncbi:MAG TPA: hypothetical protein DF614_04275 [Methylococcaceae bacterium]|nr:hypothetical protein [Methylococcaceae bacterium]
MMKKKSFYFHHTLALLGLSFASNAWAVGGSESTDLPSATPPARPAYLSDKKPTFSLPELPEAKTTPPNREKMFIERYTFSGNTVFDESVLQDMAAPYTSRDVRIDELEALRQHITRYYIEHGYINSGARIAPDALQHGVLHIDIVEGKLDDVHVHGQGNLREDYIRHRLRSDEPLNVVQLQEKFQLLLTDPLIAGMKGSLLPSAHSNGSLLDVEITRARPYQVTLFSNNYRPPSIGAEGGGVSAWVSNLTGLGDRLDFTFQGSDGSQLYSGGWRVPLFDDGTQVYFNFTEGDSSVIESAQALNINSQVHNIEAGISHPIIDSLRRKLTIGSSFALRQNDTTLLDHSFSLISGVNSGQTQATVVRFYQEHIERMEKQVLALRSTFSVGLDALGATVQNAPYPSSEFFAWLGQGQYAHQLLDNTSQVVLRSNIQLSNHALLPLERMAVGGVNTVRGYRENELVRDEGFNSSIEFHYPLFGELTSAHHLTLMPFMDYGGAWNQNASATYLHSTGLGLNWKWNQLEAEFYWAHKINAPQIRQHSNLQDEGIHFQVKWEAF